MEIASDTVMSADHSSRIRFGERSFLTDQQNCRRKNQHLQCRLQ